MAKFFKFRAFTTFLSLWSFLISLVSGIILYFTPQGKVANWTHWTIWGLDKETWGALHINSSLIFFIIILFHIYYNWSVLINYILQKTRATLHRKWELALATLLAIFITLATLYDWQPFATIIKWNEDIKNYWAREAESHPPIPHAEEMMLTEFSKQINVPLEYFEQKMREKGWTLRDSTQTIQDIADQNDISPADFYKGLELTAPSLNSSSRSGQGWGRMTITQASERLGLEPELALRNLRKSGIMAGPASTVRELAMQTQKTPAEIVKLMGEANAKTH
jgi:hypothetical protein